MIPGPEAVGTESASQHWGPSHPCGLHAQRHTHVDLGRPSIKQLRCESE